MEEKKSIKISNAAFAFAICEASQQTNNSVICAGSSAGGRVAITGGGNASDSPITEGCVRANIFKAIK